MVPVENNNLNYLRECNITLIFQSFETYIKNISTTAGSQLQIIASK